MSRYIKATRFVLFWGLGCALIVWPFLSAWSVGCGLSGATFAVIILMMFAGREDEARIFFGEVDEIPVSCLGLLWSIIGCVEMIPILLMFVGGFFAVLKLLGLF